MSSTPLFDSLRHRSADGSVPTTASAVTTPPAAASAAQQPVPASPIDAPALVHGARPVAPVAVAPTAAAVTPSAVARPVGVARAASDTRPAGVARAASDTRPTSVPGPTAEPRADTVVPAGLVSAIDAIPARLRTTLAHEHPVAPEDLPFVEAVADALTRAVVDAVVTELDRIATTGLVRG